MAATGSDCLSSSIERIISPAQGHWNIGPELPMPLMRLIDRREELDGIVSKKYSNSDFLICLNRAAVPFSETISKISNNGDQILKVQSSEAAIHQQ
jgi:hypothetical protein